MANDTKEPRFHDRVVQMLEVATAVRRMSEKLAEIGNVLDDEYAHMAAAEKRFSERRAETKKAGK